VNIFSVIEQLISVATKRNLIEMEDQIYVRNQILQLLHIETFPTNKEKFESESIPFLLNQLIDYAIKENIIEDVFDDKEILKANIMNCFIARPSVINATFNEKYKESPEQATTYFYELSKNSNYIQTEQVKKNIQFVVETAYGTLDLTINLSKPEKDPEQIKREREVKQDNSYPPCVLCIENEGYSGRIGYPARSNHRIIKVPLLGENWYLQYSPYVYYGEHSILLSEEHRDMKIDRNVFERLLTFIEKFPHYFIGSNADLPIVGGSILSHDHYQAGRYHFPMTDAEVVHTFTITDYEDITCSILYWPLSVIRLRGKRKSELVNAATYIFEKWLHFSDKEANIKAFTDNIQHNTITPIARMRENLFELDLVLRNNRTTEQFPAGIFHPHEDVHHIKKENIGLIEVMGLAILPARLKDEVVEVNNYLLGKENNIATYHIDWANQIKKKYKEQLNEETVMDIIYDEIGYKFTKALEDAGVFKQTESGLKAFKRFIKELG